MPAPGRQLAFFPVADIFAKDADRAAGRLIKAAQAVEQRRFTTTGAPFEREKLAAANLQINAPQRMHFLVTQFVDAAQIDRFDHKIAGLAIMLMGLLIDTRHEGS